MRPIHVAIVGPATPPAQDLANRLRTADIECVTVSDIEFITDPGASAPDLFLVDDTILGQSPQHLATETPIILLETREERPVTASGLMQTILKPVDMDDLRTMIRHILRQRTVLVVDDSSFFRDTISSEFTTPGFRVETASDGAQAFKMARELNPDLITMDVEMPGMDGFTACELLRKDSRTAHIPIIFVTTKDAESDMERGFRSGAVEFFVKPFEPGTLLRYATRLIWRLESRRTRRLGVVDPNTNSAGIVAHILKKNGFAVERQHSVQALADALGNAIPELVILNLDCDTAAPEFHITQARSLWPDIPVIGFTRKDKKSIIIRALQAGAVDYLHAPFVEEELLRRVETHLQFHAMLRQLNEANRRLHQLSITDPLTGLFNRGFLNRVLSREIRRLTRTADCLSLILMDIDHFKQVNDRFGHLVGDEVLVELGNIMRSITRENDCCARYGGEEFAILLPSTDETGAAALAERIRQAVQSFSFPGTEGTLTITVSCGIHSIRNFMDGANLLKYADEALYKAKQTGRNRVSTYEQI